MTVREIPISKIDYGTNIRTEWDGDSFTHSGNVVTVRCRDAGALEKVLGALKEGV